MTEKVGDVSVDIVPDARGFQRKLNEAVKAAKVNVGLDPDGKGFQEKLDAVLKTAKVKVIPILDDKGIREQIEKATRASRPKIKPEVDDAQASAKLKALKALEDQLGKRKLIISATTEQAEASIAALELRAKSARAELKINADDSEALRTIAIVNAQISKIRGQLDIDTGPALQDIARLKAEIAGEHANINVDVDDVNARRQLADLSFRKFVDLDIHVSDAEVKAELDILTRPRDVKVTAEADTAGASAALAALGSAAGGSAGGISGLIAVGIAIAPAIVPAAAAAAAAILSIGAGATGAAAGIGVLLAGVVPIVGAVTASLAAQSKAGAGAQAAAAQHQAAADRIVNAQAALKGSEDALASARASAASGARRAADAVINAQQSLVSAHRSAATAVASAIAQEGAAERSLSAAITQEHQAQLAVTQARIDAKRALDQLNLSVEDGALNQRQTALDVRSTQAALEALGPTQLQIARATSAAANAAAAYQKVMSSTQSTSAQRDAAKAADDAAKANLVSLQAQIGGTQLQREQAQLAFDQAKQRAKEANISQKSLLDQQKTAKKAGIENAPGVISAKNALGQAEQGVIDARARVAAAQKAIDVARVQGAEQVARAERAVAAAIASQGDQARQSASAIAGAQARVLAGERSLAAARRTNAQQTNAAAATAQKAMAGLSAPGQALANVIVKQIIPGFKAMSNLGQAPIAQGILDGLSYLKPLVPVLRTMFSDLGGALGTVFLNVEKALGSPFWLNFFKLIVSQGVPAIKGMATFIGNIITGLAGLFTGFSRFSGTIGAVLIGISKKFADFGTNKSGGLGRFIGYIKGIAPLVAGFVKSVSGAVGHLLVALAPIGAVGLIVIKGLADRIKGIPADKITHVAAGLLAIVVALKGFAIAKGAFGAVSGIIGILSSGPVGIVVAVVAALAGAIALAYTHSKQFRDLIQNGLVPAFKSIWDWIKTNLVPIFKEFVRFIVDHVLPAIEEIGGFALAGLRDAFHSVSGAIKAHRGELSTLFGWFKRIAAFVVDNIIPLIGPGIGLAFAIMGRSIAGGITFIALIVKDIQRWIGWITTLKNNFEAAFKFLARLYTFLWDSWSKFCTNFVLATSRLGKDVYNGFKSFFGDLKTLWKNAVDGLGKIWDKIKDAAKDPVRFIINTVFNQGLFGAYNFIASKLGIPGIPQIPDPFAAVNKGGGGGGSTSRAEGGILPGYTPGRDVHRFISDSGDELNLSGGEAIIRPELTRAIGGARVAAANRASKWGRIGDGLRYLGGFANGGIVWPTDTRRLSPTYPGHSGVDIAAGMGAPIWAAQGGRIDYTGWGRGFGQAIFERLASGIELIYGHSSKLLTQAGAVVKAGQLIGLVGATGHATGPHLHLELARNAPGTASNRAATLAWLGGAQIPAGATSGQNVLGQVASWLGKFLDPGAYLRNAAGAAMGKLTQITGSPYGKLVAAVPHKILTAMIDKVKGFLTGTPDTTPANVVANAALGHRMMTAAGFGQNNWSALFRLWQGESNWDEKARNRNSGAYGIPQSLPAAKMAAAGADWQTNPATQIRWGLDYIRSVYGNPANAWQKWQGRSPHWYDQGGWLMPGTTVVHNGTGRPEPVFTGSEFDRLVNARGGGITISGPIYGHDARHVAGEIDRLQRQREALYAPIW